MVEAASEGVSGNEERRRRMWVGVCIFYPGREACDACAKGCPADDTAMGSRVVLLPRDDVSRLGLGAGCKAMFWLYMDAPDANTFIGS